MAPRGDSSIRFLVWTSGEQAEEDIHQQSFSRHQHAARAGHRNKKLQPDRTQYGDSATRTSSRGAKTSPRAKRSKPKTKLTPTSGKGKALLRVPPSANRMDPFDTCSVSGISACAEMMLQFAITHQWPAYATSCEATAVDKWKGTTVRIAVDSPCLLQAIIYAGSCYRSFLGPGDSSIEQVRTQSYHETLTLLRKEIEALKGPPSEELLLAIVILAINGTPDYSNRHALTTLEHYRDNEFYFRKPWAPEHFQALTSLTMSKGGLRSISIGPIAAMIFMYVTPSLEYGLLTAFPPPKSILCHLHVCPFHDQSTSGFHFLRMKRHGRILLRLVRSAVDLLYTYGLCLQGLGAGVELWHLVYARRLLQHQALSLETSSDQLYMLCRLAVTVYLIESTVLLPAILPFHDYSSRKLMLMIDECDRLGYWHTNPDLMLWTTILGGLTSRERPLRWWFAEQLRGSTVPMVKSRWSEVLSISERFLPLKGAQGEGCRLFWEEACDWLSDANQRSGRVHFNMELRVKESPSGGSASEDYPADQISKGM